MVDVLRTHPAFEDQVLGAGRVGPEAVPSAGGDADGVGRCGDDVFAAVF